jgi:hypothetical protein
MEAPPAKVAFVPETIDLSWKNGKPVCGPELCAESATLTPLQIVTEP